MVTTCEIVLPTLFVLVLAYIRSQVKPISNDFDYNPPGDRTYYEYSEQVCNLNTSMTSIHSYSYIFCTLCHPLILTMFLLYFTGND